MKSSEPLGVTPLTGMIVRLVAIFLGLTSSLFAAVPAFPGAEGYGAYAVGGRNGDVYHVTNLNASGAGSFFDAIATVPSAGRTIVFDVSGYIRFPSGSNGTRLTASKVTIAGQTAPGDGIGFYNNFFRISGDDIIVRHLRFRHGKYGSGGDCIDLDSGSLNSVLDHISMQFSTDENMSSFGSPPENLTLQYSLNAWGLESHSCGGLWDQSHATSHHNLWAHNHTRNPKSRPTGLLDWVNNVTFDWDIGFIMGDTQSNQDYKSNVLNNYFIGPPGNVHSKALVKGAVGDNGKPNFTVFLSGNLIDVNGDAVLNGVDNGYGIVEGTAYAPGTSGLTPGAGAYYQSPVAIVGSPVPAVAVTADPALLAYKKVVSNAGALRLDATYSGNLRDELDTILFSKLVNLQRGHVTRESDTGASASGFGVLQSTAAPVDTDRDGMPDYYETALGWSVSTDDHATALASSGGIISGTTFFPSSTPSGYTRLEEYLQFKAMPHGTVAKYLSGDPPSSLVIDLRKYTSGFSSSPTFAVSNVSTNGTVALSGSGNAIATFTPNAGAAGRARFDFTVTDAQGSTWTQTFAIVVMNSGLPRDLTWKGDGSTNAWDTTTNNWLKNGAVATAFSASDRVTFDDSGSKSPAVSVAGSVTASSLDVLNTSGTYTFTGAGGINVTNSLMKGGSGSLILNNTGSNTFGGITIGEGSVVFNNGSASGTAKISFNGGVATLTGTSSFSNPLEFNAPTTITIDSQHTESGNWSGSSPVTINGTSSLLWSISGTWTSYTGTINFGSGNLKMRLNGGTSNTMTGSPNVAINLGSGASQLMNRNGGTMDIGALDATGVATQLQGIQSTGTTGIPVASTYNIGALNRDSTFAGAILNGGTNAFGTGVTNINKVGTGALTLSGTSTYTGTTTVSAGSLIVQGALGNTAVTVSSGALLAGGGTIGSSSGGSITVNGGAFISPGTVPFTGATMTVGTSLTLNSNSTLYYDMSGSTAGANDKIVMSGGMLAMTGTLNFQFLLLSGTLGAGTYDLITGATNSSASGVNLVSNLPVGSRQTFALSRASAGANPSYVRLIVGGNTASLVWTGTSGSTWDYNNTVNWTGSTDGTNSFKTNDTVTFNDTATNNSIVLSGSAALQPRVLTVTNNTKNYTFSGTGVLSGNGTLIKSGTGTLTISPAQSSVASTTTVGSAAVTVTDTTGLGIGMTVAGTGIPSGTVISAITSGTTLTLSQSATAANNAANFEYFAKNTFSGGTTINAGTILLGNDIANVYGLGTGPITFMGGTLTIAGFNDSTGANIYRRPLPNALVVPAGTIGTINLPVRCVESSANDSTYPAITGPLAGGGTLNLYVKFTRADVQGDWSDFTGTINVLAIDSDGGDFRFGTSYSYPGFPNATLNLADKMSAYYPGILAAGAGTTIEIGELAGTSLSKLMGGSTGGRNFTYRIGGKTPLGSEITFAGTIREQNTGAATAIIKTGYGTWSLTGSCSYNGGTTVEQGTLKVSNTLTCGSALNVQNGATLNLASGTITTDAINIAAGATLTGKGTINGDLNNDSTITTTGTGGQFAITGDVVNNGIIRLTGGTALNASGAFVNNGTLDLLTGSGSLPPNLVNNGVVVDSSALKPLTYEKNGNTFTITIASYSGHYYQLQGATSLTQPVSWTPIGSSQQGVTNANGTPTVLTFSDSNASAGKSFYRVMVSP